MKPILFNTDMVRSVLEDRKTVTRRVVKPQPNTKCSHGGEHEFIRDDFIDGSDFTGFICKKCGYGVCGPHFRYPIGTSWIRPPSRPSDILYVRETWCKGNDGFSYRADYDMKGYAPFIFKWLPSIHMPREAARIFLRVTDVKVERLQDITEEQAQAEGAKGWMVATDRDWDKNPNHLIAFRHLWDSTIKKADRALYGWEANPWCWVIEFERISREEAQQCQ